MRALWTNELVTFEGRWHRITDAGINPLPVQRPIPVWAGRRGRPGAAPGGPYGGRLVPRSHALTTRGGPTSRRCGSTPARRAGTPPTSVSSTGCRSTVAARTTGPHRPTPGGTSAATHLSVNTMKAGLDSPQAHIEAIGRFMEAVG